MGTGDKMPGVTCDRLASHPGEQQYSQSASCYRNRNKLRQCGPVQPVCGFTFTCQVRQYIMLIHKALIVRMCTRSNQTYERNCCRYPRSPGGTCHQSHSATSVSENYRAHGGLSPFPGFDKVALGRYNIIWVELAWGREISHPVVVDYSSDIGTIFTSKAVK